MLLVWQELLKPAEPPIREVEHVAGSDAPKLRLAELLKPLAGPPLASSRMTAQPALVNSPTGLGQVAAVAPFDLVLDEPGEPVPVDDPCVSHSGTFLFIAATNTAYRENKQEYLEWPAVREMGRIDRG